jgi:hypothetical protein
MEVECTGWDSEYPWRDPEDHVNTLIDEELMTFL